MLGIDQPIIEVMIIPYKGAKYCGGIIGGRGLKIAVKVPYSLMVKLPEGLLTGIVVLGFDDRFFHPAIKFKIVLRFTCATCTVVHIAINLTIRDISSKTDNVQIKSNRKDNGCLCTCERR
jgi:hypothetical protein